jgi:hypothetical protein
LKPGDQGLLLVRAHPGEDRSSSDEPLHDVRVMISDDVEAFAGDREMVVVVVTPAAAVDAAIGLLYVDNEGRLTICRFGFAHLKKLKKKSNLKMPNKLIAYSIKKGNIFISKAKKVRKRFQFFIK